MCINRSHSVELDEVLHGLKGYDRVGFVHLGQINLIKRIWLCATTYRTQILETRLSVEDV